MTIDHAQLLAQLQNNIKDIPELSDAIAANSDLLHEYYLNILQDSLNKEIRNTTTAALLLTKLHQELEDFEYVVEAKFKEKIIERLGKFDWLQSVKVSDNVTVYVDDLHKPQNAFVIETLTDGRLKIVRFHEYEDSACQKLSGFLKDVDTEIIPVGQIVYSDESITIVAFESFADMWIADPYIKLPTTPISNLTGRICTIVQPSLHHYTTILPEAILRTIVK